MAAGPTRPGFHPNRLRRLMLDALAESKLRLEGRSVITEAASGAYVVTPVLAALAGARVQAFTRGSRFGTFEEVVGATRDLAARAGVLDRIEIVADRGIASRVPQAEWDAVCRQMEHHYREGRFRDGSVVGILGVGALLGRHFPGRRPSDNELPNQPVLL